MSFVEEDRYCACAYDKRAKHTGNQASQVECPLSSDNVDQQPEEESTRSQTCVPKQGKFSTALRLSLTLPILLTGTHGSEDQTTIMGKIDIHFLAARSGCG